MNNFCLEQLVLYNSKQRECKRIQKSKNLIIFQEIPRRNQFFSPKTLQSILKMWARCESVTRNTKCKWHNTKGGILFPTSSFHIAQAIFNQDSNCLDFSRTFFILILRQGYFRECKFLYISFNQMNHIYLNYIETDAIQIVRIRLL